MIPQQTTTFFAPCTCYDFFHSFLLMIGRKGKIKLIKIYFFKLKSVPLCRMWTQLHLILVVLLPTFTHVTAILCGQVVCSPQKCVEKKSQQSTWMQPYLFQCNLLLLRNRPQILAEKIAMCSPCLTDRLCAPILFPIFLYSCLVTWWFEHRFLIHRTWVHIPPKAWNFNLENN